jgi:hypothetical protein
MRESHYIIRKKKQFRVRDARQLVHSLTQLMVEPFIEAKRQSIHIPTCPLNGTSANIRSNPDCRSVVTRAIVLLFSRY